ncbi:MAG TPA: hypothetical protein VM260_01460 [Pirellula sp.]|nr:hypothetical protein [Pirellula sp.]
MNSPIRIKTFRSRTLQDAFQQIRNEFGPDASILETKSARFGILGRSRIEVTASTKSADVPPNDVAQCESDTKEQPGNNQNSESVAPNMSSAESSQQGTKNVSELSCGNSTGDSLEFEKPDLVIQQVHRELIDAGIDPIIANQWIDAIRFLDNLPEKVDIWTLRSEIQGWIRDLVRAAPPVALEETRQQVIALVGPAGAGKTTTLAKIAANLSKERGVSVGILSTDGLRLGSNHLLQKYAELLGWKFAFAESIEQLPSCMKSLEGCRFVLIDTTGCSPVDDASIELESQLLKLADPTETHLVIPSTCTVRSFLRYEQAFQKLSPSRMILTHLDESCGLGSLFSCIQSSSLPISYLTNGQRIPTDLIQATGIRLAQQIMALPIM